jgi:hypothetical protein
LDRIEGEQAGHTADRVFEEDEAACRSNPEWEKNRVASASAGITSTGPSKTGHEFLLSLAGRVPDLAIANV